MRTIMVKILTVIPFLIAGNVMASTYLYPAVCEKSYSVQGEQGKDLTKQPGRPVKCNFLVLSLLENGRVLIQLSEKTSNLTPLGFGGSGFDYETNKNFVTVPLERIYLPHSSTPNKPQVVNGIEGFCFLDGKINIRELTAVSCSSKIEIGTQKLIYVIRVNITGLGQQVPGT